MFYSLQRLGPHLAEISLFALSSYAVCGVVLELVYWGQDQPLIALQALLDASVPIRWLEVLAASFVSLLLSVCASYIHQYKLINRFGQKIGATTRFGDEDVWEYFNNSPDVTEWVFVRDHKLGLVYYGWIQTYSESEQERELLLRDVEVFDNETNESLYSVPLMYVARGPYDFTIEVPPPDNSDEANKDG